MAEVSRLPVKPQKTERRADARPCHCGRSAFVGTLDIVWIAQELIGRFVPLLPADLIATLFRGCSIAMLANGVRGKVYVYCPC